jgi:Protein of unknown function (DUF2840)
MTAPALLPQRGAGTSRQHPHDSTVDAARELTHVDVLWISQRVENRVRFGRIEQQHVIDRHWRVVSFAPDSIFAFLRWASTIPHTRKSTSCAPLRQARATSPPRTCTPAATLLHISGGPRVEKVLHAIEVVEALGIDPADVAPDYWRHVHNRLSAGDRPQSYTRTRHHAWLRSKRVMQ